MKQQISITADSRSNYQSISISRLVKQFINSMAKATFNVPFQISLGIFFVVVQAIGVYRQSLVIERLSYASIIVDVLCLSALIYSLIKKEIEL